MQTCMLWRRCSVLLCLAACLHTRLATACQALPCLWRCAHDSILHRLVNRWHLLFCLEQKKSSKRSLSTMHDPKYMCVQLYFLWSNAVRPNALFIFELLLACHCFPSSSICLEKAALKGIVVAACACRHPVLTSRADRRLNARLCTSSHIHVHI